MSYPKFELLCNRGGTSSIIFKPHYVMMHNQLKDVAENVIIPYTSICSVEEEHINDGLSTLRRIHIHLNCGRTKLLESNRLKEAEEILLLLLSNAMKIPMQACCMTT